MTDSRKLTDNELEQVSGGAGDTPGGTPGYTLDGLNPGGFSIGEYVKCDRWQPKTLSRNEIVYRIDTLNGINATATKYVKDWNTDAVTTTTGQSIILSSDWTKLDSKPGWVPAN